MFIWGKKKSLQKLEAGCVIVDVMLFFNLLDFFILLDGKDLGKNPSKSEFMRSRDYQKSMNNNKFLTITFAGMNFKKIFFVALFMLNLMVNAQTSSFQEVVYLKNGSVIKGNIMEWVPNESITIQTADKSLFVFKISEVERVKRELTEVAVSPKIEKNKPTPNKYESNIALGFGSSSGKYGLDVLCFNWVYGKNIDPHHFLGAGTGVRYFDEIEKKIIKSNCIDCNIEYETVTYSSTHIPNIRCRKCSINSKKIIITSGKYTSRSVK